MRKKLVGSAMIFCGSLLTGYTFWRIVVRRGEIIHAVWIDFLVLLCGVGILIVLLGQELFHEKSGKP